MNKVSCAGILVADLIAADLPRVSPPGDITFSRHGIGVHIGGHAANVSINLMRLGMKQGEVSCLGAVGRDLFGGFIEKTLSRYRVSARLQHIAEAGTSLDLILVVKGEDRRFHCDVGANSYFDPAFVLEKVRQAKPLLFYGGGVGLMDKLDRNLAPVLKKIKQYGCITFLDPVKPPHENWRFLRQALVWTDILHCNDKEAIELAGTKQLAQAIQVLASSGPQLVLISQGAKGVLAAQKDRLFVLAAFRVRTLDPTGAGDSFCAGFIRRTIQKLEKMGATHLDWTDEELTSALIEAEAAGAACVTGIGTTSAVSRKNVLHLLATQGSRVQKSLKIESIARLK